MTEPLGRREANKQATRTALRSAAKELFASQGYERTTIRDIARQAKVTERTFYRYFDGKEDLVADEFRSWMLMLTEAILTRPADEPALIAVQQALLAVAHQAGVSAGLGPLWVESASPPAAILRRSTARPLLRLEETIASALLARPRPGADGDSYGDSARPDYDYEAHVIARTCVAAVRSAIIQLRTQLAASATAPQAASAASDLGNLVARAFAIISAASRELSPYRAP
ncbi:MAG: TetR/AcrR family transcriptional regulator [Streptosporangiaceae bacterium]